MKVILLDDVQKLGRRGEVRDVSDGYARNFLIPKKLALSATAGNLKNLDHIKKQANAKADRIKGDAEAVRDRIEALMYEERRQASERSEEHTSELQSRLHLVCRLLLEKKKKYNTSRRPRTALSNSPHRV